MINKRVAVTGGAGFLGSHVVQELHNRGFQDVVIVRSAQYDLSDPRATERLYQEHNPNIVIHLAARVGGIGANRKHPGTFFRDNMSMGFNVLEQSRKSGTEKVVVAGTICSYPKFTPVPFREENLWNGYPEETNAPYGIAKKALLVMAQSYRQEFGCNFVFLLPVNLYGPKDNFDLEDSHVIPAMIRRFVDAVDHRKQTVTFWGDGSPTREFLFVEDAARGIVDTMERYNEDQPMNLGSGNEISIRELATTIARVVGYNGEIVWDSTRPNGQPRRWLDVSRAKEKLGFSARVSLETGIERTVTWYREHQKEIIDRENQRKGVR